MENAFCRPAFAAFPHRSRWPEMAGEMQNPESLQEGEGVTFVTF